MLHVIKLGLSFIFLAEALSLPTNKANNEWRQYKVKYGKIYEEEEDAVRYNTYLHNKRIVNEHNIDYQSGRVLYRLGVNQFTDMIESELKDFVMKTSGMEMLYDEKNVHMNSNATVPVAVDWRNQGVVTSVKDQGQCGSCWAFSTTGALESQHALRTGQLISLSEQNLIDCQKDLDPCTAGWPTKSFMFIKDNGGIDAESSYPYRASVGTCNFDRNTVGATDTGFVWVSRDEESLTRAVSEVGPLSVCITASTAFHRYQQGIFEGPCSNATKDMDHCVLLVGYGTEQGIDYWLVKNSWGASWGDNGYIKIRRNYNNLCGIANYPSYPTV